MFICANRARLATRAVVLLTLLAIGLNSIDLFNPVVSTSAKLEGMIKLFPSLFFVASIWMVERAFKAISIGEAVEIALGDLMKRLGICLFLGGISFVFLQPLLLRLVLPNFFAVAWFDVPSITLGCLGLLLFLMARHLKDAGLLRAEMDDIL
jgi:hypothetical protein